MKQLFKAAIVLIAFVGFVSCDGGFKVDVYSMENNSVAGLFKSDTILDGQPVPDVKFEIVLASTGRSQGLKYSFRTDSTGIFREWFVIPPMRTQDSFNGYLAWEKEGFASDTIFFNHSSVARRIAIVNLVRND